MPFTPTSVVTYARPWAAPGLSRIKKYASDYASFVKDLYDNSNVDLQDVKDLEHSIEGRISELPKQCQSVFRLCRQEYISNQTIAERLNISMKTVENYLTQALKHLRSDFGFFDCLSI